MFIYTLGHQENNVRAGMFPCLNLFSMAIDSDNELLNLKQAFMPEYSRLNKTMN